MGTRSFTLQFIRPLLVLLSVLWIFPASCGRMYTNRLKESQARIESLVRIASYEYTFKEILYFGEKKSFFGITTADKGFLASLDMTLTAGYDLTEGFGIESDAFGTVTVTLPPPKILAIDADETSIREYYSYQRGGALTHMDLYAQIDAVKPALKQEAVERGILDRAEQQAQMLIGELLLSLGFTRVVFQGPPSFEAALP